MLTYPEDVLAAMDAGRENIRGLIRFDLGGGTYGFTNASTPYSHGGVTYVPGGALQVSALGSVLGTTAEGFTIRLAESLDDGLTPAVLSTIENEDYRDRPVTIYDVMLDPDTGATLSVEAVKRGYIDTIEHHLDPVEGMVLVANCEDRSLDYSRRNARQTNTTDQARRDADDTFFDHVAVAGKVELKWGE